MRLLHSPDLRAPTSLRRKTLLIISVAMLGLVGGLYALSRVVLLRGFSKIEDEFARQNLERASSALANELEMLDRITSEYAEWDQTYAYMQKKNPGYVRSEFPGATFLEVKINFVVILDTSGREVFSKGFNLAQREEVSLPDGLKDHLKPGSLLATHHDQSGHVVGILRLPSGPMLIDSHPILKSNAEGPAAGTLIMGRLLDSDEILHLGEMTHMPFDIETPESAGAWPEFHATDAASGSAAPMLVQDINGDSLAAYEELNDIYGKPVAVLRILLPRKIYQQGHTSLLQFLLLLLAAAFAFGAVTLYLLERAVLARIANLATNVTLIGASGDLSARLDVPGQDELSFLGTAINGMLADLDMAQAERHEGRTRLDLMMERMPAILWTTDKDLRFTSGIGAGLEALGLRKNELVGQTLFEYYQTKDAEFGPIAAHRKALAGESVTYEVDWQNHIFESHVQPLRDAEGELIGVIGVALDITDRKHLADQLRQSQKMQAVGELAGGVAHDFNNLLMVMKGHAEMLLERLPVSSPQRTNVEQIEKAAERAASLTRQLLAFSRKQVLHSRVLDLNEVVAGMIQMVARVIGENIELAFLPGASLGSVKADPSQIEQVLLNLVVNARDAMPEGGRLTIETSNVDLDKTYSAKLAVVDPGPYVMLTVTDTGCGMDAQTQSRIFEPFFTTKEAGKGTGLGLATVYGVVKQSGGYIWVYSEIGQGTTFKIYLPKVLAESEKSNLEKTLPRPAPGTETILLVEDEEGVRELVRDYLRNNGYHVLEAADGVKAQDLAAAHRGPIQLLITDVVMPRVSGRELATRLTAARPHMKVLYISGYTDDSIFRHGVLEGGMAFLQKPFTLKSIGQKIREVLDGELVTSVPGGISAREQKKSY